LGKGGKIGYFERIQDWKDVMLGNGVKKKLGEEGV